MKKLFAIILSLGLIMTPVPGLNTARAEASATKIMLGMANGIIGSAILLKCKLGWSQPSLGIYFAGSLVYVAAEVAGGKSIKKMVQNNSARMDELKATMKEGGDYQSGSVDIQIQKEQDLLDHINKKKKWMNATSAVYTAAAVAATVEAIIAWFKPDIGLCTPDGSSHLVTNTAIVAAYNIGQGFAGGGLMGAGLVGAGALAAAKFGAKLTIGSQIMDKAVVVLNSSIGRIAAFGAMAYLVKDIADDLDGEAKDAQKRITELMMLRAQFDNQNGPINPGATTSGAVRVTTLGNGSQAATIRALPNAQQIEKLCFSNSSKGAAPEYSQAGCKSPLTLNRPKLEGAFGEVPALKSSTSTIYDLAQAVANGDLSRADIEAANLANNAASLKKALDTNMVKVNDMLKKQGKSPIDFNKELEKQVSSLNSEMNKQNPAPTNSLAASSQGKSSEASASPKSEDSTPNSDNLNSGASALADTTAGIQTNPEVAGEATDSLDGVDPNALAALSKELNANGLNEGEIASDSGISIFKQVSNRYFLNYTKLFNRKKVDPPLSAEESAPAE